MADRRRSPWSKHSVPKSQTEGELTVLYCVSLHLSGLFHLSVHKINSCGQRCSDNEGCTVINCCPNSPGRSCIPKYLSRALIRGIFSLQ